MIITRLSGGVGNQLFQYALGRNLAIKNGTVLKLDLSYFDSRYERKYCLKHFNIQADVAQKKDLPFKKLSKIDKLLAFADGSVFKRPVLKRERGNIFNREILTYLKHIYLEGYWQNERYFIENVDLIKNELGFNANFSIVNSPINQEIKSSNSVSVHIRRGDYVNHALHITCSLAYYIEAMEMMAKLITNTKFFIFSDDIAWCKQHIVSSSVVFIEGNQDIEDLRLMTLCKHHIIANSSFSWWGAYLSTFVEKIVIAPKQWYHKNARFYTVPELPTSWIRL